VSTAIRPDNEAGEAFKECVLIRHPRNGSFAIAFVTGTVNLAVRLAALLVCATHIPFLPDP